MHNISSISPEISLYVHPFATPITWEDFVQVGSYAIALDGYVPGPTRYSDAGPHASFDHHHGVDRLSTRATCAQVLMSIRMGLFQRFRDEQGPRADVFVNDCDEDVCLSWALLCRPDMCQSASNPLINRLVAAEDMLDSTAGMYPFPADAPLLRELAWIFEPYRLFRQSGGLQRGKAIEFRSIIDDVAGRVFLHVVGRGREVSLDTRYEVLHRGRGWTAVQEIGANARAGMFADGIRAFVSVRQLDKQRWAYAIGKASSFIPLDLEDLTNTLNNAEACTLDRWGGGNVIMGSPRAGGSTLSPDSLFAILDRA